MTLPLPSVSDLETFLGVTSVDASRGLMMLTGAYNLCLSVANPLPTSAEIVVLAIAARAFSNPEGITSETVGPYSVQRASGGLYLTKGDRATLRRLNGGAAAFSIDTLPTGVSAVQLITVTGSPTGGTFTLGLAGQVSASLPFDITGSALQSALQAVPTIGVGNVSVAGSGPYTVTFIGNLATRPIDLLTAVSGLTGGTSAGVQVTNVTTGIFAPGQNLPYWDNGYLNLNGPSIAGSQ
jgi:hypothetical protein